MKKEKLIKKANEWCRREGLEPKKYSGWLVKFYFFLKPENKIEKYYYPLSGDTCICDELCHCTTAPDEDVYIGSVCCQTECIHCMAHSKNSKKWIKCDVLKEATNLITK